MRWLLYIPAVIVTVLMFIYDPEIISLIAGLRSPFLNSLSVFITNIPLSAIVFITIVLAFFVGKRLKLASLLKGRIDFALYLASLAATGLIVTVMKYAVGRIRPFIALKLPLVEHIPYAAFSANASFPSGNASLTFVLLPFLYKHKGLFAVWLAFSVIVSMNRLYTGLHYPGDVIAGAIIALFIGHMALCIRNRLQMPQIFIYLLSVIVIILL